MNLSIRDYRETDALAASHLAADAFYDDPAYIYVFPKGRKAALQFIYFRLFRMRFNTSEKHMKVMTDGDKIVGMISGGPSTTSFSTFDLLKHGLALMPFRFGIQTTLRALKTDGESDEVIKEAKHSGEYDYIAALIVSSDYQRRGIGTQLLRQHLQGRKKRVVLLTTKPDNVGWYENHGFSVKKETLISDAFPLWLMSYEAQANELK